MSNHQVISDNNRETGIREVAEDIVRVSFQQILMSARFMQHAIGELETEPVTGLMRVYCDGRTIYYDPALMIRRFKQDRNMPTRILMHVILHFVFHHNDDYDKKNKKLWDLACDIAVENIILSLKLYTLTLKDDPERSIKLSILSDRAGMMHAQSIYRLFLVEDPSIRETEDLERLFKRDDHDIWDRSSSEESIEITEELWKRISERIKADVKSFSGGVNDDELKAALDRATVEKVDYGDFLRRFMVTEETIRASDDEFDYIYYTYGLNRYGNMPLIEPLEYTDDKRIREFCIAIDTSASCSGDALTGFLRQTVGILSDAGNFFTDINVHIIQCDNTVRSDTVIKSTDELAGFIENLRISGAGATDFRPVFEYIDDLRSEGVFYNLRGLLYFTDGYGIYPSVVPDYDTAFVFLNNDQLIPEVPDWAIRVVLDEGQLVD